MSPVLYKRSSTTLLRVQYNDPNIDVKTFDASIKHESRPVKGGFSSAPFLYFYSFFSNFRSDFFGIGFTRLILDSKFSSAISYIFVAIASVFSGLGNCRKFLSFSSKILRSSPVPEISRFSSRLENPTSYEAAYFARNLHPRMDIASDSFDIFSAPISFHRLFVSRYCKVIYLSITPICDEIG